MLPVVQSSVENLISSINTKRATTIDANQNIGGIDRCAFARGLWWQSVAVDHHGLKHYGPVIADMAFFFEQQAGQRVDVQSGGSGRGINDTLGGVAYIGMSSRALTPQEQSVGLVAHRVAWDGIAVISSRG